jgi:hypothetical protein
MPKILILSSNPRRDLNLDREVSDLTTAIQRLGKFEIALGLGVRSQELTELLAEHSPQFVHFCGHGAGEQGLVFQDTEGQEQIISTELLTRIFKTFANEINCTVLNACDSNHQAEAIVAYINYVIGMSQPVLDQAAHLFSVGFYKGLTAGKSIEQAYEMGCIAIQIWTETNNAQSTQSRQYRKLGIFADVVQPLHHPLAEYMKPVLLKRREHFPSSLAEIVSIPGVTPLSVPTAPPMEFVEYVQQEIDRKDYKDGARAAYDNFGQFSAQNAAPLTKSESQQRKILLDKVEQFWIEGFLKPSLQGVAALSLDLKDSPDAIADLSQGIEALSVELDASYERLRDTQIYKEMGQGRTLLILGAPGAGKTIALLQLAQRLIERCEQNLKLPMPVVFNLSSWAKDQKSIFDWLVDELREKYQVPKLLSEPWIQQQQLILLLDGLDEVKEKYRNDCVNALNEFIGLFPQTEVAVCSRVRDYEALSERLQISSALCLQPLSSEQVYQFLDIIGGPLTGLKTLLKRDMELEKFAQTPLILNFMSVAYQGWSVEELIPKLSSTTDRQKHLFDTYIDYRLKRGSASEYSKDKVLYWLSWLASRMVQEKQTIFLIEKMQPSWLQNQSEIRNYRIRTFLVSGLSAGLIIGMFGELFHDRLGFFGGFGLIGGLFGGLIVGIITVLPKEISPLEKLSWSWQRAKSKLVREFFVGLFVGLIAGLIFGIIYALINGPVQFGGLFVGLIFGLVLGLIFGLSAGLIFGLGSGLGGFTIEKQTVPNQGIRNSLINCLIVGLIVELIFGLVVLGLNLYGFPDLFVIFGLIFGLSAGMRYGGAAVIQHFTLRQMLRKKGYIPKDYVKFLDYASDRLLMKKIGGGYVFFHRMLLEHLARIRPS